MTAFMLTSRLWKLPALPPTWTPLALCDLMIQQFTSMTFDGLTGTGMTWDTNGRVSKDPKGMVIKDGAYAGLD